MTEYMPALPFVPVSAVTSCGNKAAPRLWST